MSATVLAAFLHLCPSSAAPAGLPSAPASGPDGTELRFVVTDKPAPPGCRSLDLGGAQVDTLQVLGRGAQPATTILLQGGDKDGRFAVSEQTLVPDGGDDRPGPQSMPLRTNLLPTMKVRSYGVEERVQARLEGARLHIACRPGSRPAGVLLTGPWTMPRLRATLRARFSGKGQFGWQAADAAHAAREAALDMGQLTAGGGAETAHLALPANLDRASWRQFVIACPNAGGTLTLDALALEPDAPASVPARSTWIWDRSAWAERGDALLAWAERERIGELFIVVTLEEGRVKDPQALGAFIRRAGQRGIGVSAVEGDPHMVLPTQRAATAARARAYAAYNAAAAPGARLKGIQFDIEPYLLPEHVLPAARLDQEYVATLAALREAAGATTLEFVIPFWWDDRADVLAGLARYADALTVMDYRTDPGQIMRFALPFLDWGAAKGKRVRIALEAGPLPRETQRRYRRAPHGAAGDMLLFTVEGQQVLVLLRQPLAHPAAQPYRLAGTRVIDGSATTFHADKDALRALLPRLEADFGAWPGFDGIALHELR